MIGSFWNFCKACPSMPTDKFRSEYRSTYRWHEFQSIILNSTENKQVIRKAPQLNPAVNQHIHLTANQITVSQTGEMEPLVSDEKHVSSISEYKKNYRPFSQYDYSENEGRFTDKTITNQNQNHFVDDEHDSTSREVSHDNSSDNDSWYKEVLELRKKAEEYKHRGWGMELASDNVISIYNKQLDIWNQVSQRSSLSALSLASALPKKMLHEHKAPVILKKEIKEVFRHHLHKTTGGNELDGLILSPTRDKLEPVILNRYSLRDTYQNKGEFQKFGKKVIKSNKILNKSSRSHSAGPISNLNRSPRNRKLIKPKFDKINNDVKDQICHMLDNDIIEIKEQEDVYLVKTPPEPTRVKSPEQIVIRSPEPVNWTVPLETTKSFIVTQNINPFNEMKHKIDVENVM